MCEIFLHGTILNDKTIEAADLYVYRLAELKAVQIGNVNKTSQRDKRGLFAEFLSK